MPSPWRWMYAQLYNWNLRKWGRRNDPAARTLGQLSVLTFMHLAAIFAAYATITHHGIPQLSRGQIIVLCAAVGLFFYVRFVRRGEADQMIAELKLHDAAETRRDFRKLATVVSATVALLVLAMAAMAVFASRPK